MKTLSVIASQESKGEEMKNDWIRIKVTNEEAEKVVRDWLQEYFGNNKMEYFTLEDDAWSVFINRATPDHFGKFHKIYNDQVYKVTKRIPLEANRHGVIRASIVHSPSGLVVYGEIVFVAIQKDQQDDIPAWFTHFLEEELESEPRSGVFVFEYINAPEYKPEYADCEELQKRIALVSDKHGANALFSVWSNYAERHSVHVQNLIGIIPVNIGNSGMITVSCDSEGGRV